MPPTDPLTSLCNQIDMVMRLGALAPDGVLMHSLPPQWDAQMEQKFRSWCGTMGYEIREITHDAAGGGRVSIAKA